MILIEPMRYDLGLELMKWMTFGGGLLSFCSLGLIALAGVGRISPSELGNGLIWQIAFIQPEAL